MIGSVVKLPAGGTESASGPRVLGTVPKKAGDLPFGLRQQLIASGQMNHDPGAIHEEQSDPLFAAYVARRRHG